MHRFAARVALVAGAAGLALTACAPSATASPHAATTVKVADPHHAAALVDAASLLASYSPPPGAVPLSRPPAGSGVSTAPSAPGSTDLIDLSDFWRVAGSGSSVLGWVEAHPPAQGTESSIGGTDPTGSSAAQNSGESDVTYSLSASGSLLYSRQLTFSVAQDGPGQVLLRLDAQEVWYPSRPAWSLVPANTGSVAATVWTGSGGADPHRDSTTAAASVSTFVALINAMPVDPGLEFGCPAEFGQHFEVQLGGAANGMSVGSSIVECGSVVSLTRTGHGSIALLDTGSKLLTAAESLSGTSGFSPYSSSAGGGTATLP